MQKLFLSKRNIALITVSLTAVLFSLWLMTHTFSFDRQENALKLASTVWSDFGAHIPLIRSFSYGANIPPESPLFPGEPIRYHFLFYLATGMLEKIGVRLDLALNVLSAVGLSALIVGIYVFSLFLFNSTAVSILTVLFFIFNGSFSFINFFRKFHFSQNTISEILNITSFPSFGPWDDGVISAFWNLNIYTNQRHLALSYALSILIFLIILAQRFAKKQSRVIFAVAGLIWGLLALLNQAAFAITSLFIVCFFVSIKKIRLPLVITVLIIIPFIILTTYITQLSDNIFINIGYLINKPLTLFKFFNYWIYNLGFHFVLIPIGFMISPKKAKVLIIPLLLLFILPNIFQFSPDMINNHKFFNFFIIIAQMYSAYLIVFIVKNTHNIWQKIFSLALSMFLVVILTFSGLIDLMVIRNDSKLTLNDLATNRDIQFFYKNTPRDAVVLNSTWLYHPASLAGRKVFAGYSYFTWSYGYDKETREQTVNQIYNAPNLDSACDLLNKNNIKFVELNQNPEGYINVNWNLWNNAPFIYENTDTHIKVFELNQLCLKHL